jgi:L-fuculose-phosphate aldolase
MAADGLVDGSLGNVSCRRGDAILITPTQLSYETLRAVDVVVLGLDGGVRAGRHLPSSEFRLHLAIYRAIPEATAIVHTHSTDALALSALADALPAITDELALLDEEIPVVEHRPAGSQELADLASSALSKRVPCAAILERHGVVGVASSLEEALTACRLVERGATVWLAQRRPA